MPPAWPRRGSGGAHPAVAVVVEDLGGQRDAVAGLHLRGNVLAHPHAVLLVAGDVQLRVVHLQGLQEAHHILLFLFDLEAEGRRKAQTRAAELRAADSNTGFSLEKKKVFDCTTVNVSLPTVTRHEPMRIHSVEVTSTPRPERAEEAHPNK